jgi:hypothetical protein
LRNFSLIVAIPTALLAGCSERSGPTFEDPAACVAAFDYVLKEGVGTPLANDKRYGELKTRIAFELEKLQNGEGLSEGQKRAELIAEALRNDQKKAYDLAVHCTTAEEAAGDYDKARIRLEQILSSD